MATKALTYSIGMDYGSLLRDAEAASEATRGFRRELQELEAKQRAHRQSLVDLGEGMAAFGGAVVFGLGMAANEAIKWEAAFTGVRKTVDGSDAEIAALEQELRGLAKTLPITHEEIAGVAEAAGQLGIKRQDIKEFTKTMVDLGQTTNLTAEEAATELAKFSNIMGTSAKDVDRLGAALVALGNDGASTEADIISMALRIAGAGKQVGYTESNVLSLASALSSVGIEAEAGGSSISRVMINIEEAVRNGGAQLEGFAQVAGVSATEFQRRYGQDAVSGIQMFLAGLNRISKEGGNTFEVLENLGFKEILVRDALLRASAASDMFTHSIQVGSQAWAENTALTDEANKRYDTAAARMQVAMNQMRDAAIEVGGAVLPIFADIGGAVSDLVTWFNGLPGPVKDVVTVMFAATGGLALFGGAALIAVPKVIAFRETMRTLVATGGAVSGALGKVGLAMIGPWGAALALGSTLLTLFGMSQTKAAHSASKFTYEIDKQTGALSAASFQQFIYEVMKADDAMQAWADDGAPRVKDILKQVGVSASDLAGAIAGIPEPLERVNAAIAKGGPGAASLKTFLAEQTEQYRVQKSVAGEAAKASDEYAKAQGGAGDAAADATPKIEEVNEQVGQTKTQAKEAADALSSMLKAMNDLNGVSLTFDEAQRKFTESQWEINDALKENGRTLASHTKEGLANQRALAGMASAAGDLAEAAAREAEKVGGAAAGQLAYRASLEASRPMLIDQYLRFENNRAAAEAYADRVLAIPRVASTAIITPGSPEARAELRRVYEAAMAVPPNRWVDVGVISEAARARLNEIGFQTRTLPNGQVQVYANTDAARRELGALTSNINSTTGTLRVRVVVTDNGGLPPSAIRGLSMSFAGNLFKFASGGMFSGGGLTGLGDQVPMSQVAPTKPGHFRMWAEDPSAPWESYITPNPRYRSRNVAVLGWTADQMGFWLMPKGQYQAFAAGGFSGGGGASTAPSGLGPVEVNVYLGEISLTDSDGTLLARVRSEVGRALGAAAYDVRLKGGAR